MILYDRHPEVRAKRASKGDGPGLPAAGTASFEALAALGHLRMTVVESRRCNDVCQIHALPQDVCGSAPAWRMWTYTSTLATAAKKHHTEM